MTGISNRPQNFAPALSVNDFIEKSNEAGKSGRVILSETDSGDICLVVAKKSFKDHVLSFLKNFPLFKNTEKVKNYIKNIETSNQQVLALFVNALAKCYKSAPSTVAFSSHIKNAKNTPLNQLTVHQLKDTAETYYGLGAARNYSRKVRINLWPYENMNKAGHASITIKNKDTKQSEHVSWWPDKKYQKAANSKKRARIAKRFDNFAKKTNEFTKKTNEFTKKIKIKINTKIPDNFYSNFENQFGGSLKSYKEDKKYEIGTAGKKMKAGEFARQEIENRRNEGTWSITRPVPKSSNEKEYLTEEIEELRDNAEKTKDLAQKNLLNREADDLQLLLDSSMVPRSTQIKNKNGKWGAVAQQINFPMVGKTTIDGSGESKQAKFVLFGLNEKSILADAKRVKENAQAYLELEEVKANLFDKKTIENRQKALNLANTKAETLKFEIKNFEKKLAATIESLDDGVKNNFLTEFVNSQNSATATKDLQALKKSLTETETNFTKRKAHLEESIPNFKGNAKNLERKKELLANTKKEIIEVKSKLAYLNFDHSFSIDLKDELKEVEEEIHENRPRTQADLEEAQAKAAKTGPEIGYTFASDSNNCASMAINVLRAGGAENYVAVPKMTSFGMSMIAPDEQFSNYVKSLQKEIDQLNNKADFVLSKLETQAPISEENIASPHEMEKFKNESSPEWKILSEAEKGRWKPMIDIISSNFPSASDDMKTLTLKSKNLVIATEELFKKTFADKAPSPRERGVETFLHQVLNLHKQHIAALTTPDE